MWQRLGLCPMHITPIHFFRAKFQDADINNVTSARGEIITMNTKEGTAPVIMHPGKTNLTLHSKNQGGIDENK